MKKLLAIMVLGLFLITPSAADDIRDFQIEGMSIGDSLLDNFSEKEIKKNILEAKYPKNNAMKRVRFKLVNKSYDSLIIHYKKNDNKYLIYGILGSIDFKDFNNCYKTSENISKEIGSMFPNIKVDHYEKKHAADKSGKSTNKGYTYWLTDDSYINIACYDWSSKMKFKDHLRVEIVGEEFLKFLKLNYE